MPIIEFLVQQKKIEVGKYANLKWAAKKHGIDVGNGIMEIVEGSDHLSPKTAIEKALLKDQPENIRMSGQAEVLGNLCVITDFKSKPSRQ
jgi:hypothetical protein